VVSYYDNTSKDLKLFQCADTACTAGTIATLDTVGDVGSDTAIAIGADNLPIISYQDFTNGDLKVAHVNSVAIGLEFG